MKRVAVFQLGSLGDTLVTLPAWRAVRAHFAGAELILVHDRQPDIALGPADILAGADAPDRIISYSFERRRVRKLRSAFRLFMTLRRLGCSAAVYLAPAQLPARTVARDRRFFRLCGIKQLIGFHVFDHDELHPRSGDGSLAAVEHESIWRLRRLQQSGVPVRTAISTPYLALPAEVRSWALAWLRQRRRYPDRLLVAICPGSKQSANWWPVERFGEVGAALLNTGRVELLIVGGTAERRIAAELASVWTDCLNAAGEASVLQSAGLLSQCGFALGLDTGTTHLGAALGVPFVALYGGRDHPGRWEPLGARHTVLRQPVSCAGCQLRACPLEQHPCMRGIQVPAVIDAALSMLSMIEAERGNRPRAPAS